MVPNNKKKTATVTFSDHRGARKAKEKGRKLHASLPPVSISYIEQSPRSQEKVRRRSSGETGPARAAPARPGAVVRSKTPAPAATELKVVTNSVTGEGQQGERELLAVMRQPAHSDPDRWGTDSCSCRDKYFPRVEAFLHIAQMVNSHV